MKHADFMKLLNEHLHTATPGECVDVAVASVMVAAYRTGQTPRCVLDDLWHRMDDERYENGARPVLDALLSGC